MKLHRLASFLLLALVLRAARPMTFDDLAAMRRLSDPQPRPGGGGVLVTLTVPDLEENRTDSDVWLVPDAGAPRRLTASPKHDRHARWSPDGRWIVFESNRGGEFQLWILPSDGGEARPLTSLSTGATAPAWSPDGRAVAFLSSVYPGFSGKPPGESDKLNRERIESLAKSRTSGRVFDQLPVRKWDAMNDGRRQHLFVVAVTNGVAAGEPRDVTPGARDAVPWSATFAAGDEFAWAASSSELFFTASQSPVHAEAWSTDHDIHAVDLVTGRVRQITTNTAADGCPRPSPDGRWLAYRAQARPGFEADRWGLFLLELSTGIGRPLAAGFDTPVENIVWAGSSALVVEAEDKGRKLLWSVPVEGGADASPKPLTAAGSSGEAAWDAAARSVVFTRSTTTAPAVLSRVDIGAAAPGDLWNPNADLLTGLDLPAPESVKVRGADDAPVQMWILRPPGFDPARKWPLVFWVHGGPQGAFLDAWSYRWNPQVWAARGYVIAMPNPRGSTGFGQAFTDQISRDWGGGVYADLMAALAWCEACPWIDKGRMAAAGASYGGYMMNWFQGHTDKFRTLVTHCGVYEFHSMYGSTDELWFDEWEHGVPWETPDFAKDSPDRYAAKFRTPNLVIHNELDYRVPVGQGLALFTALQRQGVPSRLLYFPDEGHWVLKPSNSRLWHETIFEWLGRYLGPG